MHPHTYTLSKSFQVIKFVDSFWQEPNAEAEIQNRQRCPARCKLCHALKNASRKTIESSSQIKVRASFEFLRILFLKFVLNLGRGWQQFNAHMLRFMCFVGFAWPECKTKRHFILCNVSSFFLPWLEVEQGMAEGVTLCLSASHKEILLLRLYSDSAFRKWVFMSILNYKFYKKK